MRFSAQAGLAQHLRYPCPSPQDGAPVPPRPPTDEDILKKVAFCTADRAGMSQSEGKTHAR